MLACPKVIHKKIPELLFFKYYRQNKLCGEMRVHTKKKDQNPLEYRFWWQYLSLGSVSLKM